MQVLTEFAEYNYEWQFHLTGHTLEAVYRLTHQRHTPSICKVCHLPVRYKEFIIQLRQLEVSFANSMKESLGMFGNLKNLVSMV